MKRQFKGNELKYIQEVLDSGLLSARYGDMTHRFEQAFAEKMNAKYAVAVNSGTSALYLALRAWHLALKAYDIGEGDSIIVPCLGPTMTAVVILLAGAAPVFADIDPETYCIAPSELKGELITTRTAAVMPVHIFGNVCDMDEIKKGSLYIIEDCAQSLSPLQGDIACYSFEQSKHICCGDGGMVVTDDKDIAKRVRQLSDHGISNITGSSGRWIGKAEFNLKGHNMRMPEVVAAVGLAQLETAKPGPLYNTQYVEDDIEADRYEAELQQKGIEFARAPWDKLVYEWPMFGGQKGLCPVAERLHPNLFIFPEKAEILTA